MSKPLTTGMPPDIDLGGGCTIRLTALDPTTGAVVANVNVSNLVLFVNLQGSTVPIDLVVGPYELVPGPGA
jgi:hypothetical protein